MKADRAVASPGDRAGDARGDPAAPQNIIGRVSARELKPKLLSKKTFSKR